MRVTVLYFGVLKDIFRVEREAVELPVGATVGGLLEAYRERAPEQGSLWGSLAIAVNLEYAGVEVRLKDGDEVAMMPPVSGGTMQVELTRERIAAEEIVVAMKDGADGAVVVFDGIVRDNTRGRRTLFLDYEAYEEMALAQMRGLAADAVEKFGVRDIALVHRLGRLKVGETSVLIVVASAHRGAAFDACRWVIDTLKKTVPIWKREHFEDGAVWSDGEPFPAELTVGGAGESNP